LFWFSTFDSNTNRNENQGNYNFSILLIKAQQLLPNWAYGKGMWWKKGIAPPGVNIFLKAARRCYEQCSWKAYIFSTEKQKLPNYLSLNFLGFKNKETRQVTLSEKNA